MHSLTRRNFMRIGAGSVAAGAATKITLLEPAALWGADRAVAPSDQVRFAVIGTGTRGCELLAASLAVPGVECVAVCDLYDSRHEAAQEALQKQVPATRNYQEILEPQRCRRGDRSRHGPSASPDRGGCLCRRQGRVLREADVAYGGRRLRHGGRGAAREIASCRWAASASVRSSMRRRANSTHRERWEMCSLSKARRTATRRAAPGFIRFRPTRANRPSTGMHFSWALRSGRSMQRASSAGAASPTTAKGWPAICSSTCSREFSSSRERTKRRSERKPAADCFAGRTGATSRM